MPSGKSLFNFGLFWKNVKRFWPIWGMYLLIWIFALPVRILTERYPPSSLASFSVGLLETLRNTGLAMAFVFGPLCAMAVFSYLYKAKSANLIHALPTRREGLFLTNFLSGLSFLVVPNVLVFLLTLAAAAARGWGFLPAVWLWPLAQCLICLFFYCFTVFCAMFTGALPALPIFYVILNFIFPGLYMLTGNILQRFLYGFVAWSEDGWVTALWPLVRMSYDLGAQAPFADEVAFRGLATIAWYGLAGLVLAAAALLVYRRRHIERAGDVVSVNAMRPVFKYGVAFCCALVFGTGLYEWLGGWRNANIWVLTGYLLFCGALGYFIAEMLLRKSFRVFRAWRGCAAFLAVLLVCCAAAELDLTGYERRVPSNAVAVELSGVYSLPGDTARHGGLTVTDPALIAEIQALHTAIVQEAVAGWPAFDPAMSQYVDGKYPAPQSYTYTSLRLTYTLPGGGQVRRRYDSIPITDALLSDPNSAAARLEALLNHPALNGYAPYDRPGYTPNSARLTFQDREVTLSTREAREVYAALHEDFAAGRIGHRFLLENGEYLESCYVNDLIFQFAGMSQQAQDEGVPYPVYGGNSQGHHVIFTLQTTATSTIDALIRLGVIDSTDDLTTFAEEYATYRH